MSGRKIPITPSATHTVPQMTRRLENAGFRIKAVLGDYSGQPWDRRADVWLILAEKC